MGQEVGGQEVGGQWQCGSQVMSIHVLLYHTGPAAGCCKCSQEPITKQELLAEG